MSKLELSWGMLVHLGDMLEHLRAMLTHLGPMCWGILGAMLGHLGAVLSHLGVMLLPSWCQEGLSSRNIEKSEILDPPDLTGPLRGVPTAGTVFLRFPSKMLLKPLVF